MTTAGLTFHHLGLAVRDDTAARGFLRAIGYKESEKIFDPMQCVYLRFCTHEYQPAVEIVQPGESPSPIDRILEKNGEIIYHVCFETENIFATLASIENNGFRCIPISPRKPAVLFGGRYVSFYRILGYGVIELLEKN
jgi:methylmalonyl-CoA/ethylmalonyl-CoA epimerase